MSDNQVVVDLTQNEITATFPVMDGMQGKKKYKTQQMYQGVPIFGATLVIQSDEEGQNVAPVFGNYYSADIIEEFVDSTDPEIFDRASALELAMAALDIESDEEIIDEIDYKLWIYHKDDIPFLSWIIKFSYINQEHVDEWYQPMVIIDANNGIILDVFNQAHSVQMHGCGAGGSQKTGEYHYCGAAQTDQPAVEIDNNDNPITLKVTSKYEVYDNHNNVWSSRGDATPIICEPTVDDPTVCNIEDRGGSVINGAYCAACDVFAFTQLSFAMYKEWMDVDQPVVNLPLKAYVHVGDNWGNAVFASGGVMAFGDGHNTWHPLGVNDVVSHEIAHGFTDLGSDLIYSGQSGGMNEAYSDITGEAAEAYFKRNIPNAYNDWATGSDVYKNANGALRYMCDPPKDGNSIDNVDSFTSGLNVHYSSGLYNKAACWLDILYGWSLEKIFRVFSTANMLYWTPDSTFNEGVCGLDVALQDLFGMDSNIERFRCELQSSFDVVGLSCADFELNCNDVERFECPSNSIAHYCLFKDIQPSNTETTSFTQLIRMIDESGDNVHTMFEINFRNNDDNINCVNPRIGLVYEQIDYDQTNDEFIQIFTPGAANEFTECRIEPGCREFATCVQDVILPSTIESNTDYTVTVIVGDDVDDLCSSGFSVNAQLTITCDAADIQIETPAPVTPAPVQTPAPVTPAPIQTPAPITPAPVQTPAPITPAPVETPAPVTPAPVETPAPITPAPVETPSPIETPAPITPAPIQTPAPITPAPVQTPAPVTPAPIQTPAPVTPAPVQTPAPVTPAPVQTPAPVTPAPVTPASNICCGGCASTGPAGGTDECVLDTECTQLVCVDGDIVTPTRFIFDPDPYCCQSLWDFICVNEAEELCSSQLPIGSRPVTAIGSGTAQSSFGKNQLTPRDKNKQVMLHKIYLKQLQRPEKEETPEKEEKPEKKERDKKKNADNKPIVNAYHDLSQVSNNNDTIVYSINLSPQVIGFIAVIAALLLILTIVRCRGFNLQKRSIHIQDL